MVYLVYNCFFGACFSSQLFLPSAILNRKEIPQPHGWILPAIGEALPLDPV